MRKPLVTLVVAVATALAALLVAGQGGGPPEARAAPANAPPIAGRLTVEFLDVGQGDATLVTSPTGKRLLVDGGPPEAGQRLAAALARRGITSLDLVLLTHPHLDHLGGLRVAFRQAPPKAFLDPGIDHPTRSYERLLDDLGRRKVPVRAAVAGRKIDLGGGAVAELLWPPREQPKRLDVNDRGAIVRISHGEVAFLIVGDAGARTEALLLRSGAVLRSNVLKVGHHGSRHSSAARFLAAVGAREAVLSVGAKNPYGHPHEAALARLAASGATIRRTDLHGTITYVTDGRDLAVQTGSRDGRGRRRR